MISLLSCTPRRIKEGLFALLLGVPFSGSAYDSSFVKDFSLGAYHTCALMEGGVVFCWGKGNEGELGAGIPIGTEPPLLFSRETGFTGVFAGGRRTCVQKKSGELLCAGLNLRGELMTGGFGIYASSREPTPIVAKGPWKRIAMRGLHSCAVREDGVILCAGDNAFGQLGTSPSIPFSPHPLTVPPPPGELWEDVQVGYRFTCALTRSRTLYCFGDPSLGSLGGGRELRGKGHPVRVNLSGEVLAFSVGGEHACAIAGAGFLFCWGRNDSGQAGEDPGVHPILWEPRPYPFFPDPVTAVACGARHTCFLADPGRLSSQTAPYGNLYCFGSNRLRELGGASSKEFEFFPQPVDPDHLYRLLRAGEQHTCALTTRGELSCFGANLYGESGTSPALHPAPLTPIRFPVVKGMKGKGGGR
jgi:alpha-tubulin suppressor-like RCC1 family protein